MELLRYSVCNSEDNTPKYPDLVATLHQVLSSTYVCCSASRRLLRRVFWIVSVLHGIAKLNAFFHFKYFLLELEKVSPLLIDQPQDVKEEDVKINVVIFMFECIYLNGRSLLQEPLLERRKILRENIHEVPGRMQFATNMEVRVMITNKI